jgi:hypothetical protein
LVALACVSDPRTARQCHHLAYMAEFIADIWHVAGQDNVAADARSRPPTSSATVAPVAPSLADSRGISSCQSSCPSALQASKSPSFQEKACEVEVVRVLFDVSTGCLQLLVPEADRPLVFNAM